MRKTISLIICCVLILSLCNAFSCADSSFSLYLDIDFEQNALFSKYDIYLYLDNQKIATLDHGKYFTSLVADVSEGMHNLFLYRSDKDSVNVFQKIELYEDSTAKFHLSAGSKKIEISKFELLSGLQGLQLTVPDFKDAILSTALADLKNQGFSNITYAAVNEESVLKEKNWIVTEQEPLAETVQDKNDPVVLKCRHYDEFIGEYFTDHNTMEASEIAASLNFAARFYKDGTSLNIGETLESNPWQSEKWIITDGSIYDVDSRVLRLNAYYTGDVMLGNYRGEKLNKVIDELEDCHITNISYSAEDGSSVTLKSNWYVIKQDKAAGEVISADTGIQLTVTKDKEKAEKMLSKQSQSREETHLISDTDPSTAVVESESALAVEPSTVPDQLPLSTETPVEDPATTPVSSVEPTPDTTPKPVSNPELEQPPKQEYVSEPETAPTPESTPEPETSPSSNDNTAHLTSLDSSTEEENAVERSTGTLIEEITVYFLDVGQGDAAVVECEGHVMMIDGGGTEKSDYIYSFLQQHGFDHLEYIVATHPAADHIGGLAAALNYAKTENVYCNYTYNESTAFLNLKKYTEAQGLKIKTPAIDTVFNLGSAEVTVLGPHYHENNSSIVLRIVYKNVSFLFTGDCESNEEQALLQHNDNLKSTVLKVGHHGSKTSTTQAFFDAVSPEYAVISVAGDNTYGHPDGEVLDRFYEAGTNLYRTDMNGTVIISSDGTSIKVEKEKEEKVPTVYAAGGYDNYVAYVEAEAKRAAEEASAKETESRNAQADKKIADDTAKEPSHDYIVNINTGKFHYTDCSSVLRMKEANKKRVCCTRSELISQGYSPCGKCNP